MSALAIDALAAAKAAGVALRLKADEGGLVLEVNAEPPPDVLAALRAAKPDLLRILAGREAAKTALNAQPPLDCPPQRWATALRGLQHFIGDGWGDQASLLGWTTARALSRTARLGPGRPHRRRALDRRSAGGRRDRSLDRH